MIDLKVALPYGEWTTEDGRTILFNRDYHPIWQRHGDSLPVPADRAEWVPGIIETRHFYDDADAEVAMRRKALAVLRSWRV